MGADRAFDGERSMSWLGDNRSVDGRSLTRSVSQAEKFAFKDAFKMNLMVKCRYPVTGLNSDEPEELT